MQAGQVLFEIDPRSFRAVLGQVVGQLVQSKANVEQAKRNLGFTHVRSLITGIAGLPRTQVGNLVGLSTAPTSVSQVDPIKVYFSIRRRSPWCSSIAALGGG
ncbi:MAG TPA: hypothetical protein VGC07_01975 [Granulicella sp.]